MSALSFLGFGQRERPPLQLYGKLPNAKDFLRVGCAEGAGRGWRDWLDNTFGSLRDGDEPLVLDEPMRFIGWGQKEPLFGCLWPSTDAGGQRSFPFTLFFERRRKALFAELETGALEHAEGLWRWLVGEYESCLAAVEGREVLAARRGAEVGLDGIESVPGSFADFAAWSTALWPTDTEAELARIVRALAALGQAGHRGPCRLPLVRDQPLRDQVLAWLDVVRAAAIVPAGDVPTLFMPFSGLARRTAPAHLVVSARPLAEVQANWLTSPADAAIGPGDFASAPLHRDDVVSGDVDGSTSLREALKSLVARELAR